MSTYPNACATAGTTLANKATPTMIAIALLEADVPLFFPEGFTAIQTHAHVERFNPAGAEPWAQWLERLQPQVLVSGWGTQRLPQSWIDDPQCPLRYVCNVTGSVRHFLSRKFIERGGLVTNWGSLVGSQVAEHALLLALCALREQPRWLPLIRRPVRVVTHREMATRSLFGRKVAIHGFGTVARALISLLQPFGVKIACYSEGAPLQIIRAAKVEPCSSLAELAACGDVFFECEALTENSTHSINAAVIAAMPHNCVFVNVGRGKVTDEVALIAAARAGKIRIALDVADSEPWTQHSPLLTIPGAVLSPHIAGPTTEHLPQIGSNALANICRYLKGKPLEHRITEAIFDRST